MKSMLSALAIVAAVGIFSVATPAGAADLTPTVEPSGLQPFDPCLQPLDGNKTGLFHHFWKPHCAVPPVPGGGGPPPPPEVKEPPKDCKHHCQPHDKPRHKDKDKDRHNRDRDKWKDKEESKGWEQNPT